MNNALSEHDLYELVADFGVFLCTALRRDHDLAQKIDGPEQWLSLADLVGHERATLLKSNPDLTTENERTTLIEKQISAALKKQDPDVTPTIWLCESDNGKITLIEGWGEDLNIYLRFRVIGHYASRDDALDDLHRLYFTTLPDQ